MQITYATEAGTPGRANEDLAVCGPGWAVVLDGATAPEGVDSGCIHDVPWLVHHLAAAITGGMLLGADDLRDVLAAAIEETCKAHVATCDLFNPDSPSSTVSIVRARGGSLDYLAIGDSPMTVRAPGHGLTTILDDRTAHLPGGRPYSIELVRSLRNKPDGFWVASTDPEAAYRAVTGSMPYTDGTGIGMFTDGVSRLIDFYGYGWEELFAVLETSGPAGLIALVRSFERDEPVPYGKRHDDATAVLMSGGRVAPDAGAAVRRPAEWRSLVGM